MNVLRCSEKGFANRLKELAAESSLFDPTIEERTREILQRVFAHRDKGLLELTEKFDGAKLSLKQLTITQAEILTATAQADAALRKAVAASRKNVEFFAEKSLRKDWSARNEENGLVGEKFDPYQRVGIYVPGGTAPLVSTAIMTVCLAKVAGCRDIVVCTPCGCDGSVNPALLYTVKAAGATEVYRIGGAQAVAAMAYGTPSIPQVQKIFGPGNAYVVAAKRMLFGHVAIDLLPGPSELLVLADETANARYVAADLLAQAEHGSGHERVWLVTTSGRLLQGVLRQIKAQLPRQSRRKFIQEILRNNGWLIQVKTLEEGIQLTNQLAPEHCEIQTQKPAQIAKKIVTAGALFLGEYSPTVLGDYLAGPSHTLPTGGAGASFAGLTVDQFQRRTSIVTYNKSALKRSLETVATFADVEGLEAHGRSAKIRFQP